ncbi:MAG: heavy-metal-associated domain-containing protein [Arcobacteraceae bacterium]
MNKIVLIFLLFANTLFSKSISEIKVEGMHCPLCTTAVKKAVKKLDGIEKVRALLNTKTVTVTFDEKKVSLTEILKAIKTTSYVGVEISTQVISD